jgi:hypothetical protein
LKVKLIERVKTMLELDYLDKCIELFNEGKISGLELAELLLKKGDK